jgi:hypothetical protein
MMAHGDQYILPEWIINNEFYELRAKFSTSKGNVVSVRPPAEAPRTWSASVWALRARAPAHRVRRAGLDQVPPALSGRGTARRSAGAAPTSAATGAAGPPVGRSRVAAMLGRSDILRMPPVSRARTRSVHIDRWPGGRSLDSSRSLTWARRMGRPSWKSRRCSRPRLRSSSTSPRRAGRPAVDGLGTAAFDVSEVTFTPLLPADASDAPVSGSDTIAAGDPVDRRGRQR